MTNSLQLFGKSPATSANFCEKVGLPINPFRPADEDIRAGNVPFFTDYIDNELTKISQWVDDVHVNGQRQPIALVGNIGADKTIILGKMTRLLRQKEDEKIAVDALVLSDTGYGRISVGSWLVVALERLQLPWLARSQPLPPDVLPIIYFLTENWKGSGVGSIARALEHIRRQPSSDRMNLAQHLSNWIKRGAITDAQSRKLGLARRLDVEGEFIPVVGEILSLAKEAQILNTFFLFIDQIEDLFSKGLTVVRRSRVFTDLRALIDVIDAGAPMGLLLSLAPNFDNEVRTTYPALHTRLARRRVDLPLLEQRFAEGFTKEWMLGQKEKPGYDVKKQPTAGELSHAAWLTLRSTGGLYPGDKVIPRAFLTALADELDQRAR
jgi:hypothetical protein